MNNISKNLLLIFTFVLLISQSFTCTFASAEGNNEVMITKNPTSEALAIGGKTWFIAHASNADRMVWEMVDLSGVVHSLSETMEMNPGLSLQTLEGDTIAVSDVPLSLNGWGVRATFYGDDSLASTTPAYIYVGDFLTDYAPVIQTYRDYKNGVESSEEEASAEYGELSTMTYYVFPYERYGVSLLMRYDTDVGYYLKDLNKDGIPELLIGYAANADNEQYPDKSILVDLFTLVDNKPVRLLASSERVTYWLRSDNLLYLSGSGGAAYHDYFVYKFNGKGFDAVNGVVMYEKSFI